jgi:8-oxo-dGTP pyrophosphatase MutT (NUDIX family)
MRRQLEEYGFRAVGRMPTWLRRSLVRLFAPSFSVGAMCVIERDDGARLFIRHSYRQGWGLPGGLLKRGEHAADAAQRETLEEVGLEIVLVGPPTVVVDPHAHRVDVVFRARPVAHDVELSTASPEIVEAKWFPAGADVPSMQWETERALRELQAPHTE